MKDEHDMLIVRIPEELTLKDIKVFFSMDNVHLGSDGESFFLHCEYETEDEHDKFMFTLRQVMSKKLSNHLNDAVMH